MSDLTIGFRGERFRPVPGGTFDVGRDGDLGIEDNPYLHRRFLRFTHDHGVWWLANVGSSISATVCDAGGGVQSWLSPGGRLPLVLPSMSVVFTAGPTTYVLQVELQDAPYRPVRSEAPSGGATTIAAVAFTITQKQLLLALAEPVLGSGGTVPSEVPTAADAARRLGWAADRFHRKLDDVCDKLDRVGVEGLRGGSGVPATNRRARLVEYAVASRLVTAEDLHLLDLVGELS